ncbi:MAG: efflux RND transporter periplasmic adaptor subunit [Deltaproteobacteria bacterium]|nr:efflux RND transporter periplasmic adaptor subunit [Deltaproteobacteria bacterium]
MKRKLLIFTILTIVVVAVVYLVLGRNSPKRYITAKVERGDVREVVSATGTVNAVTTVQVGSQVSGVIRQILVDFNSRVKKGQVIAYVDPDPFKARVDQARASLEASKATLENVMANIEAVKGEVENARANVEATKADIEKDKVQVEDTRRSLNRIERLWNEGLIAEKEKDTAQANYETALAQMKAAQAKAESALAQHNSTQARLKVAEAQRKNALAQVRYSEAVLEAAQLDLSHTTIISPVDGIVISRNVDVGQTVAASLQAPTLFLIAQDLTKMQVNTNISEADIGRVREEDEATFTVDAYPEVVFSGRITQIRNSPVIVQNVVTYDVVIAVDNKELRLKPGMTANAIIPVVKKEDVLKIPIATLRFKPDIKKDKGDKGRGQGIWILTEKGELKEVPVKTGIRDGNFVELLEGDIKEGQEVVTGVVEEKKKAITLPGFGQLQRMRF